MTVWDVELANGAIEPRDGGPLDLRKGHRVELADGAYGWVLGRSRAESGPAIARRVPKNPHRVAPNFGRPYQTGHLQKREVLAIIEKLRDRDRDRALVVTLWRTGLRCAEALALVTDDIDLERQTIRVREGKGGKPRTVGLDEKTAAVLEGWLGRRPVSATAVFCGRTGKPITTRYAREMVRRAAAAAGVTRRVHPHAFRHTFAVELAEENVPPANIQRLLGHSSLATTTIYLESLSPEAALNRIRSRDW